MTAGTVFADRAGVARVPLACTGSHGCRGSVSVVRALPRVLLGGRRFSVAAGHRLVLTVRLNRRARSLLARRGEILVRVIVRWQDGSRTGTTSRRVKLERRPRG